MIEVFKTTDKFRLEDSVKWREFEEKIRKRVNHFEKEIIRIKKELEDPNLSYEYRKLLEEYTEDLKRYIERLNNCKKGWHDWIKS